MQCGLIALLLYSDGALLWDKDDLRSYEEKDRRMSEILEKLGDAYPDSLQQNRIDTVRLLLAEKKTQILRLAETPSTASRMDSLLSERLPPLEQSAALDGQPHGQSAQRAVAPAGTVRLGAGPCGQRTGTGKRKEKQEKFLELVQAQEEKGKGRK